MVKKAISKRTDRGSEQFQLRLPTGMRKQLAEVAEREGRTMNSVIIVALVRYFETERQSAALRAQIAPGQESIDTEGLEDLVVRLDQKLTELIQKADTGEIIQLLKQIIK
jgi:hypothetical protein